VITNYEIKNAKTTVELDELVEKAAFNCNCELDNSLTYKEQAEFFAGEALKAGNGQEHMDQLVEILETAETKWHELEA
jgi:hypothetical protein